MARWQRGTHEDHDAAQGHFERAVVLFEAIRRDAKGASAYKYRLFDLQTECYQVGIMRFINRLVNQSIN